MAPSFSADPGMRVALLGRADFAAPAVACRPARTRLPGAGLRVSVAGQSVLDDFVGLRLVRGRLAPAVALGLAWALAAPTRSTSRPQEPA